MKPDLSKQQGAVLTRTLSEGGTCRSTAAYAALVEIGGPVVESEESSMLAKASSILQSLVELGFMVKSKPGEYHLTEEGSRVAEHFRAGYPFA
jgi:hypothetical protein